MPLTDDDFVKNGKLEGYSEMIQKLHDEEQTQPEITYDLQLDDEDEEEEDDMVDDLDDLLSERPKERRSHSEKDDTFQVDYIDLD